MKWEQREINNWLTWLSGKVLPSVDSWAGTWRTSQHFPVEKSKDGYSTQGGCLILKESCGNSGLGLWSSIWWELKDDAAQIWRLATVWCQEEFGTGGDTEMFLLQINAYYFLRAVLDLQKTVQTIQWLSIESFTSHSFFQLLIYYTSQLAIRGF